MIEKHYGRWLQFIGNIFDLIKKPAEWSKNTMDADSKSGTD